MRISSYLALPLLTLTFTLGLTPACGSSVSCQNPTPSQPDCASCINSSCSTSISQANEYCPGYLSCYSSCNCADNACVMKCSSGDADAGTACTAATATFLMCAASSCKTQCATKG